MQPISRAEGGQLHAPVGRILDETLPLILALEH